MITHHPSDDSLARLAAGTIGAGPRLVVATHLTGRPPVPRGAAFLRGGRRGDARGGAARPPEPGRFCAGAQATRCSRSALGAGAARAPPRAAAPLNAYEIGPWRFVHPGFRWRRLTLPESPDANVIMLKVAAGRRVPRHGHSGTEYTQVVKGSFADALGQYRAGDCVEMDEGVDHQPVVDTGGECVCLASVEGRVRLSGWIGRLLQPLIGEPRCFRSRLSLRSCLRLALIDARSHGVFDALGYPI